MLHSPKSLSWIGGATSKWGKRCGREGRKGTGENNLDINFCLQLSIYTKSSAFTGRWHVSVQFRHSHSPNHNVKDDRMLLLQLLTKKITIYLFSQLNKWQPFFTHCYDVHQLRNEPNWCIWPFLCWRLQFVSKQQLQKFTELNNIWLPVLVHCMLGLARQQGRVQQRLSVHACLSVQTRWDFLDISF